MVDGHNASLEYHTDTSLIHTRMLNVNIGIMGHVDSGKTSLSRALSVTASTAAFDKSPQSQERGITLDLGFSSRNITAEDDALCAPMLAAHQLDSLTCTFVDCPGHASLIRTIVSGAQIIDIIVLVIDAAKGIQPQTAECLVIGEILCKPLVVVLNKIDMIQGTAPGERAKSLQRMRKKLSAALMKTRWPVVQMLEVAAAPSHGGSPHGVEHVIPAVLQTVDLGALKRRWLAKMEQSSDFLMLSDHCFPIRGHGTVFTGTVLRGRVDVGDVISLPEHGMEKKVKSLQVFKKNVSSARAGDRVGLCVSQFDAASMERGIVCSSHTPSDAGIDAQGGTARAQHPVCTRVLIARVHRVRFHQLPCDTSTKFHLTLGHTTVMATLRYFSRPNPSVTNTGLGEGVSSKRSSDDFFDASADSFAEGELPEDATMEFEEVSKKDPNCFTLGGQTIGAPVTPRATSRLYYAVVLLEQPLFTYINAHMIGMRLDVEREGVCRIAFTGNVQYIYPFSANSSNDTDDRWRSLPVYRYKLRTLVVDRVVNERSCIASGLVLDVSGQTGAEKGSKEKHAEAQKFVGMNVFFVPDYKREDAAAEAVNAYAPLMCRYERAVKGTVASTFGKTGKVTLEFSQDVFREDAGKGKAHRRDAQGSDAGNAKGSDEQPFSFFATKGEIVFESRKTPFAAHFLKKS